MSEMILGNSTDLLSITDISRKLATENLNPTSKRAFGQYMTPARVASFMASLFPSPTNKVKLLDPGAGVGSLTSALIAHLIEDSTSVRNVHIDAYEIDPALQTSLTRTLDLCKSTIEEHGGELSWHVFKSDFILDASDIIVSSRGLWGEKHDNYTHCIMNPPYQKISSQSRHRSCLRSVGIETVNLYSAFVAMALSLMDTTGLLVAIIPRSFCNGPYYRHFRQFVLNNSSIKYIHLFGSRNKAFRDDNVLQENIIIMLERGGIQHEVTVSTSTDDTLADFNKSAYPFDQIVNPGDTSQVIYIPASPNYPKTIFESARFSLDDLGIKVSTGPIVDFRLKEHLRKIPTSDTVPLLYPCHFSQSSVEWPLANNKKPNAIIFNQETLKWLYSNGFYTVVRRFSSKEEKRRIIASVVDPNMFSDMEKLGFENHLNVFHNNRHGLPERLAKGLAVFLNSTIVDNRFRCFSGHTQVNANDLRRLEYPSREVLIGLGNWAMQQAKLTQDIIDEQIERILGE